MRHSLITLAAAALAVGIAFGGSPAKAASLPKLDNVSGQNTAVKTVRYYRRWGYRPYRYWGAPYRYYAPPRYNYYYGPPYARYYRPYAYWGRPYYGRRYWYHY
jgi:hypothetical protein